MTKDQLHKLIKRYLTGIATDKERQELMAWYEAINQADVEWVVDDKREKEEIKMRMLQYIGERSFLVKKNGYQRYMRYAAAVLLFISVSLGVFLLTREDTNVDPSQVMVSEEQIENRHVLLADSTIVILRPGSTLTYLSDFRAETREVRLEGEAYFDVKSKPDQPFIIHTDKVKTTVLGTKFTIRADYAREGVEVMVREGKVRVEREKTVIAELAANQQIQYDLRSREAMQEELEEEAVAFAWTFNDMRFDAMPFGELAEKLERRYDVKIVFENDGVRNCPVSGRFDGTETLENVLHILCTTRNASFTVGKTGQVTIHGDGC